MKWGRLLSLLALLCLGTLFATSAWASEAEADGGFSLPEEESLSKLREKAETFHFQAEVNRMMTLIINSLYRNKEIFLRELISNASDALDKIRFLSLTNPKVLSEKSELSIKIQADPEHNALHIADSGIGMTKEDLIRNLGTIAKSGTADFLKKVEEGGDLSMIGQFGVGFYSVFLVADRVTVTTKHNDDKQYIWESTAESDFSIIEDPRGNTLGRGTVITLHLKPEASDYLKQDTLKSLIKKYSEFINFPIYLWTTTTEKVEVPVEEGEEADRREDEDEEELEDVTEDEDEDEDEEEDRPKTKLVDQAKSAFELVNESKPIWLRPTSEVEESEYKEFFKAFFKESEDPLATSHFKAEGEVEFRSLLFVPPRQPPNLYGTEPINEIKLFVRRVFITDTEAEPLLPTYLRFIKGVVDSDDLPLNVSRETLQQSKLLRVIKKKLTKKALDMLKDLSADSAAYLKFYKEFYNSIKLGIIEDASNRKRLAKLLRFKSSESPDEYISLDQYLERRKQKQSSIYFLTGSTVAELKASPFLERLSARGYEVLFLVDPIDEYTFQSLTEYEGKKFVNAAKDNLKLGDDDESEDLKELKEQFEPLLAWLNHTLTAHIQRVILSTRLTTSPCALVAPQFGWSGNMERIARSQAYAKPDDPSSSFYLNLKKNLEINPKHPVILNLLEKVRNEETDEDTVEIAKILFDTATLRSGYDLKDPVDFAARIEKMLRTNLGVDLEAKAEVNEPKVPLASEGEEEDEDAADAEPDFSFNPMDGMPEDDEADGHDEL